MQVGDTAGHQGHQPSLPATGQECARALWHSLGHPKPSPGRGRSAGSRNRCKIPVAKPQGPRGAKREEETPKGSLGLSDGNSLHVHPRILPFIQLLMGLSRARRISQLQALAIKPAWGGSNISMHHVGATACSKACSVRITINTPQKYLC